MTTKNYVALFRGLGYPTAYLAFQNKYKDNLKGTTSFKKNGKELFVDYYDINNTAVIVGCVCIYIFQSSHLVIFIPCV